MKQELAKEEYKTLLKLGINLVKKDDLSPRTAKVRLPQEITSQQLLATNAMKQLDCVISCLNHVIYLSDCDPSALNDAANQVNECILRLLSSQAERLYVAYQFKLDALQPAWEHQRDAPVCSNTTHTCVDHVYQDWPTDPWSFLRSKSLTMIDTTSSCKESNNKMCTRCIVPTNV